MRVMTAIRALCVGMAFLVTASPLRAEKPEVVALIDQLVVPNPKPIDGDKNPDPFADPYETPPGFDETTQEPAKQARAKLVKLGVAAFPDLIEHWDDERYSLTTEVLGHRFFLSVGNVCRTIIYDQLQPYGSVQKRSHFHRGRPEYPTRFLVSADDAKTWWKEYKDLSLRDMQLMAIEWIQAEEAKQPRDFTSEEREYLAKVRNELVTSGKPLEPGNDYEHRRFWRPSSKPRGK